MEIEKIIEYMESRPYTRRQGSQFLAGILKCDIMEVKKARAIVNQRRKKNYIRLPKILIFDIETSPLRAYVWKLWKNNINLDHIISEWFCLAWSAKWLYSADTIGEYLTSEEALNQDDSRIMKDLWNLINKADIIIAYNGEAFDIPRINTRFLIDGFPPPKPYFVIDPCKIAKRQFGFSSNKMDALAGYFGIPHKLDTDFSLWERCMRGDQEALKYMSEYNKKDTEILEEIYLKMRPWIKNHPNIGNYTESTLPICSTCGATKLEEIKDQYYYTSVGKYKLYRCKICGAVSRGRKNINVPNKVKLLSSGK